MKTQVSFALIGISFACTNVLCAPAQLQPEGLLSTEIVTPLLAADPAVAAVRSDLAVAEQEAKLIQASPYEWNVSATQQRRRVNEGVGTPSRFSEWSAGIERTLRLPNKRAADFDIADAGFALAQANYQQALRATKLQLLTLWLNALSSQQAHELAALALSSMQQSVDVVTKRLAAGDASQLELKLASAELAEQRRLENAAKTQAQLSAGELAVRFPGLKLQAVSLAEPKAIETDLEFWRTQIIAESGALKAATAELLRAQAQADRARADRIPDPTLGVFRGSESDGGERITGITISIPIPGGARATQSAKAIAARERAQQALALRTRELDVEISGNFRRAKGAQKNAALSRESAKLMAEAAALTQRAFALGEADLPLLLLAQRQANLAASAALAARAEALNAYYQLLLDANMIWADPR